MAQNWMIYGAYGYSGELIAREAVARGLTPMLAGRNEHRLRTLANELHLGFRVFDLSDSAAVKRELEDMTLVLHCAGPFSATSGPMLEGCLASKTHYLDITGEMDVFEHAHREEIDKRAREAGIIVCPGVGFDVVPTDCLAAQLKRALPDLTELDLAFKAGGPMSPGTAKTSVEGMAGLSRIRKNGRIVETPLKTRRLDMGQGERTAVSIPWGDVSTAYHSIGVENIAVYVPVTERTVKRMKRLQSMRWLMGQPWVQAFMKRRIEKNVPGPTAKQRAKSRTYLWGEARNAAGKKVVGRFETPNGYDLTITAPLAIVTAVLNQSVSALGSTTPSALMGSEFVWSLPGVTALELTRLG
ncbi:trans-acting enoyl reductase family protein [Saccharospirillum sp.]|uniref:trans-acting enoyl reductase family protein n=1 Tax=Saccharospirillum sp. TaxID=2033801 RepID=UPI00349FFB38